MAYYLATKRNKVLVHSVTLMNLENIMPSERNQTLKGYILHDTTNMKFSE